MVAAIILLAFVCMRLCVSVCATSNLINALYVQDSSLYI